MLFLKKRRPAGRRRGLAIMEFALVGPVLVFLVMGMIETARGFMVKATLTDAARRGCRTGILPGKATSDVSVDVNKVLSDNSIKSSDATMQVLVNGKVADASTAIQNDQIAVKISIPVSKIAWITPFFLPAASIESESMVMMRQR